MFLGLASYAIAGGGDGSDVLGAIKDEPKKDDKTLAESLSGIFDKNKEAKPNDAETKVEPDKNTDKKNSKNSKEAKKEEATATENKAATESNEPTPQSEEELLMDCKTTPSIYPDNIPKQKIGKSNNLMRKAGSARRANGQYIEIIGKVVDEDCVPIPDVEVQIWQADSAGKYLDDYAKKTEWDVVPESYDRNFAYSGAAQTNNLGEFSFITILPASNDPEIAPHINFFVRHPDFREVATMMFFDKHPKNDTDKNLIKLKGDAHDAVIATSQKLDPTGKTEGRQYMFIMTLEGISKYKRF